MAHRKHVAFEDKVSNGASSSHSSVTLLSNNSIIKKKFTAKIIIENIFQTDFYVSNNVCSAEIWRPTLEWRAV